MQRIKPKAFNRLLTKEAVDELPDEFEIKANQFYQVVKLFKT